MVCGADSETLNTHCPGSTNKNLHLLWKNIWK